MDKKDILEPFRLKYSLYFKNKYCASLATKKKNFNDIMEMSSILLTSTSQYNIWLKILYFIKPYYC
mgnify:CR=1 FL=1